MSKYIFKYVNEDEFNRCEKTIKKYDSLVYKKLLFSYYPNLKEGNFSGDLISVEKPEGDFKRDFKTGAIIIE